jgi:transposase
MRVLVATQSVDFRKGIDGLAKVVREELEKDPFSGIVFVFRNRCKTAIKVLVYEGQGFWLCHKRLSAGRFRYWPTGESPAARAIEAEKAHVLFRGGDFEAVKGATEWRQVAAPL